MPPRKPASTGPTPVKAFKHEDKRVNIPTADSEDLLDEEAGKVVPLAYKRDPDLDPQLVWNGKDEQDSADLVVDAPPIYIQEKIDPRVIVEGLRRTAGASTETDVQTSLFDTFLDFDGVDPLESLEYYQHEANWSNRMILGDSLRVMASLAEKEHLRGKVQMIYIDPPYGIKFGSNWQVSTSKRDVKDGKAEDTTREVEQIKAFRDTWEKGIHSYLAYLRDRLVVARDLLTESGSVFVQIGDENVHLVRSLLDEVFGSQNFCLQIAFKKTTGAGSPSGGTQLPPAVFDYILWYARKREAVKRRPLFLSKVAGAEGASQYTFAETSDGTRRPATAEEMAAGSVRLFAHDQLTSQSHASTTGYTFHFEGRDFKPGRGYWKTPKAGMERLRAARRLMAVGNTLRYIRYLSDFPLYPISNMWTDTVTSGFGDPKTYVVQTGSRVVERCLLMATDPGDLVLDPTCGSGTTAYVAEQWGRRWITVDTSRVALALTRQRIMGAKFPYYLLTDSHEGRKKEQALGVQISASEEVGSDVRKGFVYQRFPHIGLKSIANNPDIRDGMTRREIDAAIARFSESELLYDRPHEDNKKIRVAGRFTVESLSPHKTIAPKRPGESASQDDTSEFERTVLENLYKAGVQNGRKKERLQFESQLQPFAGQRIQAEGTQRNGEEGTPQRIGVSIGPQYGTVDADWIRKAAREATRGQGFELLLICAFAFDSQAVKTTEEFAPSNPGDFATVQRELKVGKIPILLVRMNSDLAMGDVLLKKTGSGNLFMVFGEPDVEIRRTDEGVVVEIKGVDVYVPTTGEIRSSGPGDIALWMIDTDYDEESFFVKHCYFTGSNDPYQRLKKALKAEIDEAAWESLYSTVSRPFPVPTSGKIAVKVINHYGDEVLQVYDV